MIADTTLLLIVIAIFSSLKVGVKTDRIFSCLVFVLTAGVFGNFYLHRNDAPEQVFSFVWNSSPSGNIMVDIVSNAANCQLILPFLLMTLLAVGYNAVFRYEERRGVYNGVLLFNLAALIMMITSNNLVQLLSGVFAVDILALLMIRDVEDSKAYATLNLLADMILFTVLAVVNCQLESLDMRQLLQYKQVGLYPNFVALASLAAVFIKFGFVPFHDGMLRLKDARFHRLQNVLFLTSPVTALVLLLKFNVLWQMSPLFETVFCVGCLFSLLWGGVCFALAANLKLKMVYLQMMFWALIGRLLLLNDFQWSAEFSVLLAAAYLLMSLFYFLYYYTERTVNVLKWQSYHFENRKIFVFMLLVFMLLLALPVSPLAYFYTAESRFFIWWAAAVFVPFSAQLFRLAGNKAEPLEAGKSTPAFRPFFWGLTILVAADILWLQEQTDMAAIVMVEAGFLLFCLVPVSGIIRQVYEKEIVQKLDVFNLLYSSVIVAPLQWCGRVLSVIVDRMLIEKMMVGAAALTLQTAVRFFRNIHYNRRIGSLVMLVVLVALLVVSYYNGRKF